MAQWQCIKLRAAILPSRYLPSAGDRAYPTRIGFVAGTSARFARRGAGATRDYTGGMRHCATVRPTCAGY